ncbi:MAG: hypothetical protein JWM55_833 [Acidimicrobiaceae bacterium]|nr:hypothetical protein [Acidimicrobiaceae bacterium]
MKNLLTRWALPVALVFATLGVNITLSAPVNAVEKSHSTMGVKTWHGKVDKLNASMGTTESFSLSVGMKIYTVHYDSMTHWVMGSKKNLKKGALVTVTGTLSGTTITAAKLSA